MLVKRFAAIALAAGISGLAWSGALAAEHEVRMVNKGPEGQPMQFDPAFLKIEPGDTVTFVATDKGHNSESILGMIPEGAETWKGKINEEIQVTFSTEGIYGYKCTPHFGMGMVGLVQVGNSTENLDAAQTAKLPGKAKTRMAELIAQVGSGAASDGAEGGATAPAN
jgi:pseudoazurin